MSTFDHMHVREQELHAALVPAYGGVEQKCVWIDLGY